MHADSGCRTSYWTTLMCMKVMVHSMACAHTHTHTQSHFSLFSMNSKCFFFFVNFAIVSSIVATALLHLNCRFRIYWPKDYGIFDLIRIRMVMCNIVTNWHDLTVRQQQYIALTIGVKTENWAILLVHWSFGQASERQYRFYFYRYVIRIVSPYSKINIQANSISFSASLDCFLLLLLLP